MRRFSDFEAFYEKIRDAYSEGHPTHLKSLPEFPLKRPRFLQDHTSKEFVEERRLLLQAFLKKLLEVPLAAENPHFWKFVGLVDYAYYDDQGAERLKNPDIRPSFSFSLPFSPSSSSSLSPSASSRSLPVRSVPVASRPSFDDDGL